MIMPWSEEEMAAIVKWLEARPPDGREEYLPDWLRQAPECCRKLLGPQIEPYLVDGPEASHG